MKKVISSILMLLLLISTVKVINAYSTTKYSIDIPSTYEKSSKGSFTDAEGDNINIQVVPFTGNVSNPFTEEQLDKYTEILISEMDSYRAEMKNYIKEKYGDSISESELNDFVNSIKYDSIVKKEITTATKNNYKCYHVIATYSVGDMKGYMEQFSFVSDNNTYTLTIGVDDKNKLFSTELRNSINSFTILDYKNPERNYLYPIIIGIVGLVVIGIVIKIVFYRRKSVKGEEGKKETVVIKNDNISTKELPMKWWNVWQYFLFPVGIVLGLIGVISMLGRLYIYYSGVMSDGIVLMVLSSIITMVMYAFHCITSWMFLSGKKGAYKVFIAYLFLYPAWSIIVSSVNTIYYSNILPISNKGIALVITILLMSLIVFGFWINPNYVYFKKRKYYFGEDDDNDVVIAKDEEEQNSSVENIETETKKELVSKRKTTKKETTDEDEKRFCTNCGKEIKSDWTFCNYCGNKLK